MKTCEICGEPFEPKTIRSRVCYSEECQRIERCNIQRRNYTNKRSRVCKICGNEFKPTRDWQTVCFESECRKERDRRKKLKTYALNKGLMQKELELGDSDIPDPIFPLPAGLITNYNMTRLGRAVLANAIRERDWEWFYTENAEGWIDYADYDIDWVRGKIDAIIGL